MDELINYVTKTPENTNPNVVRSLANSIVTVEPLSVVENGVYTADTGKAYSPVTVDVPTGGGGSSVPSNDVNFYDYDGTIVQSYTANEFVALSALPDNPSHDGLAAQGWNWSLNDAKEYVTKYGKLNVGQMYVTDDGKTRIYIHIDRDTPANRMTFYVRFASSTSDNITVDWGDGITETKGSTTATHYPHTYASTGDFVITLTVTNGTITFDGSGTSASIFGTMSKNYHQYGRIRKIEFGNNVTSIGGSTFYNCCSLTTITIPDNVIIYGDYTFANCHSLKSITVPNPSRVRTFGKNVFNNCYSLTSIVIPYNVALSSGYSFANCYSLTSITIPDNITTIGTYAFDSCRSLTSIIIPDDITIIGGYAFASCYSLTSIIIPNNVTTIGTYAFSTNSIGEYHLRPTTPPTLQATSAFNDIASDCIIYVPQGSLEAYQTATNWSTYASYMREEP